MPELPEVETVRSDLAIVLKNKKIIGVEVLSEKSARPSGKFLIDNLIGQTFLDAERVGKLLIFPLSGGMYLLVHLRMTGQLIYVRGSDFKGGGHSDYGKNEDLSSLRKVNKYTRIILTISGEAKLYFNDLRKFGFLMIVNNEGLLEAKKSFGVEPLTKEFTTLFLSKIFSGKKQKIKPFLLNQKFVAGLGNIYVDESLFASGIRPDRLVSSLSDMEIKKLHQSIQKIIKLAIKLRGTTFSDYLDSTGKKGNFSPYLQVYGRAEKDCFKCGDKITKIKLFGRGTHFCEHCQK